MHWSSLRRRGKEVLNVAKPIAPSLKYARSTAQTLSRVQISTMAIEDNLYLNQPGVALCTKITTDENAITNAVDICHSPTSFAGLSQFPFPWSVNVGGAFSSAFHTILRLISCVEFLPIYDGFFGALLQVWMADYLVHGDAPECLIADATIRKGGDHLEGASRLFICLRLASRWPQDLGHKEPIRIGIGHQGDEIDLFGEIAGVSFCPRTEALFTGVAESWQAQFGPSWWLSGSCFGEI
ncbi:hypothetical protein ACH5RR_034568 [Cinchona calisaya]|uniref:Uncharacterized protein n=1 Tax=Cinchona calisaya TaxID=153742 RepID=A0ABD2YEE0_9GENT